MTIRATGRTYFALLSQSLAAGSYWIVVTLVWALVNVCAALGIIVLLFCMLANATWLGVFREIGNLAQHFLAASDAARLRFQSDTSLMFAGLFAVISASRSGSLRSALRSRDQDTK